MAVKMRLRREGKRKQPFYRVVVADVRSPRDGRFIEDIGYYQPLREPSVIDIDRDRALYWLGQGVQPSDAVRQLLRVTGIWEDFRPGDGGRQRVTARPPQAAAETEPAPETAAGGGGAEAPEEAQAGAPAASGQDESALAGEPDAAASSERAADDEAGATASEDAGDEAGAAASEDADDEQTAS